MKKIKPKRIDAVNEKNLIATSRKLLGIIFALVRDHSVYVENYQKPVLQEAA